MTIRSIANNRIAAALLTIVGLLLIGLLLPAWLLFLVTLSAAHGIAALGIVVLMRGGLVSFGQGLFFCAGAYAAGLLANHGGVADASVLLIAAGLAGGVIALVFGPLLATFRGIFFAMLTLALSMVFYGGLVKVQTLGGSDGFNLGAPTYFGYVPAGEMVEYMLFVLAVIVGVVTGTACRTYFDSTRGLASLAIRGNELRVEYLGTSVRRISALNFTIAGIMAGLGGALAAMALGHIDPNFSYWTTSGEFVFVAILSGHHGVAAVYVASLLLELVRSFSNLYFPDTWQLALGIFLLLVILFLPEGIGSLLKRRRRAATATREDA